MAKDSLGVGFPNRITAVYFDGRAISAGPTSASEVLALEWRPEQELAILPQTVLHLRTVNAYQTCLCIARRRSEISDSTSFGSSTVEATRLRRVSPNR